MREISFLLASVSLVVGCTQTPGEPPAGRPLSTGRTQQSLAAVQANAKSCLDSKMALGHQLAQVTLAHATGCTADADCKLVDGTIPCYESCEVAVRTSRSDDFRASLQAYAAANCPSARTDCEVRGLCMTLTGAQCVSGVCRPRLADVSTSGNSTPAGTASPDPDGG